MSTTNTLNNYSSDWIQEKENTEELPSTCVAIVETLENNGTDHLLSIVPHKWVVNKLLHWPPKVLLKKKIEKNAQSKPDESWSKIPCIVKRPFFETYDEARAELCAMSSGSGTESSEINVQPVIKKARVKNTNMKLSQTETEKPNTFESMMKKTRAIVHQAQSVAHVSNTLTTNIIRTTSPTQPNILTDVTNISAEVSDHIPRAFSKISTTANDIPVMSKPTTLMTSTDDIMDASFLNILNPTFDEEKFKQELYNKLDVMKEDIINAFTSTMAKTIAAIKAEFDEKLAMVQQMKSLDESTEFNFSPISNSRELREIDNKLSDNELFAKEVFQHFKKIIGNVPDRSNGLDTCYIIIDHFFDKKFMVNCSWTGASRTAGVEKCSIRDCKNILKLFFTIVRSSNKNFSEKLMKEFFSGVTRNAKKRSQTVGTRQSSVHRRVKKSKTVGASTGFPNNVQVFDNVTDYNDVENDSNDDEQTEFFV
ncbi:hypothetical protein FQR65_LT16592 [Abscondita terminalis]|nr:hypothetical protein FQR65_LT16592 [Abscondita terminalis]